MKYSFTKVLILRPQARLLVLINSQLSDFNWQLASTKAQDLTAYLLPYFKNDEDMLNNLESNFRSIFHNEAKKIIGLKEAKKLNISFFDFLSCFKFEWHDDVKFVYQKFTKKACVSQKHVSFSVNRGQIKSLEDLCRMLDGVKTQIIPLKDLTGNNFWRQLFGKIRINLNVNKHQTMGSLNMHRFCHARDSGF